MDLVKEESANWYWAEAQGRPSHQLSTIEEVTINLDIFSMFTRDKNEMIFITMALPPCKGVGRSSWTQILKSNLFNQTIHLRQMTDLYSASIDDLENVIRFLFQQMRDNPWNLHQLVVDRGVYQDNQCNIHLLKPQDEEKSPWQSTKHVVNSSKYCTKVRLMGFRFQRQTNWQYVLHVQYEDM